MTALINHVGNAIQYYEGYNEYNASSSIFSGSTSGLVALQKVLYETVHQLSPTSLVLSPTYTGLGGQPMTNFLKAGGGAYFDIAAMHGYVDVNGESIIQSFNNFKNALLRVVPATSPSGIPSGVGGPIIRRRKTCRRHFFLPL